MKLSVCMIVKDEEKNLDRCLTSLQPLLNSIESELIIVDTGSKDGTINIAKKHTNKVYFHQWNNNFSEMRNISIGYAKGEWVLIIDADEEIEDCRDMIDFLKSDNLEDFSAASIQVKSIVLYTPQKLFSNSTSVRLFKKNPELIFGGLIHENVKVVGKTISLKTSIIHYGYNKTDAELMDKKFKRNISLLEEELKADPNNPNTRFYLAIQYFSHYMYEQALEEIKKSYNLMKQGFQILINPVFIYSQLAFSYYFNDSIDEAKEICIEGLNIFDENIDLYYCLAEISIKLEDYDNAETYLKRYLELVDNYDSLVLKLKGESRFLMLNQYDNAQTNLAIIYLKKGKYDLAISQAKKVTALSFIEKIFSIIIESALHSNNVEELNKYYNNYVISLERPQIVLFSNLLQAYKDALFAENKSTSSVNEFEQYKMQVKLKINDLINSGQNAQAKKLINEYIILVKNDKDIDALLEKLK